MFVRCKPKKTVTNEVVNVSFEPVTSMVTGHKVDAGNTLSQNMVASSNVYTYVVSEPNDVPLYYPDSALAGYAIPIPSTASKISVTRDAKNNMKMSIRTYDSNLNLIDGTDLLTTIPVEVTFGATHPSWAIVTFVGTSQTNANTVKPVFQ